MQPSKTILYRSLPQLMGVLLVAAFAGLFILYHVTHVLDRYFTDHSSYLARQALQHKSADLLRDTQAYSRIAATYRLGDNNQEQLHALHRYYQQLDYDGVSVASADGQLLHYSAEVTLDTAQREALLRNMDTTEAAFAGFLPTDHGIALVSAAPILPTDSSQPSERVLILIQRVGENELLKLGFDYGLTELHIVDGPTPDGNHLELTYLDGSPLIVSWVEPAFGRELLQGLLPILIGSTLLLALLVGLIAQNAIRTAARLESNYKQLTVNRALLSASEKRFRDIAEAASDWLWEADENLRLVYLSGRFESITHYAISDWLGRPITDLLNSGSIDLAEWLESADTGLLRCYYTDRLGNPRISQLASRPIRENASCTGYRGAASDITERVREQSEIEYLALHDPLTGLANRTQFQAFLDDSLAAARPLVVLSLDLDRFKEVNDTLGHAAGDAVLIEVSARLLQCIRSQDLVARLGGDEFTMIICAQITRSSIDQLCARVIERLGQPIQYKDKEVRIGVSIGVATAPENGTDADTLLRCADIALYQAKDAGRETWRFYTNEPA